MRRGVDVEMNAYCRRAVAEGVTLARATEGTCTVMTLGPPGAEDVLREAIAWGATSGLHVCDPAFAGSDTLATARALAAVLRAAGPFDLVLLGRNSIDGETGQVGPEVAALLDLPFASGCAALEDDGACLRLVLEHDDGMQEVEIALPAVLSVAERLCEPCKVDPAGSGRGPGVADHAGHRRASWATGRGARRAARPWSARRGPWSTTARCSCSRAPWRNRCGRRCTSSPGAARWTQDRRRWRCRSTRRWTRRWTRRRAPAEPVRPTRPPGSSPCSSSPAAPR